MLGWVSGNQLCDDTVSSRGYGKLVIEINLVKTAVSCMHYYGRESVLCIITAYYIYYTRARWMVIWITKLLY